MLWAARAAELEGMNEEVPLEFTALHGAQTSSAARHQW